MESIYYVLTAPVRERVLYPALEAIRDKYRDRGGVKVIVQTTGDLLTSTILEELLSRGVWSVSAAGMISVADHDERRDLDQSVPQFLDACHTTTPDGSTYSNICIGCDSFFRDHLEPVLAGLHRQRLKRRVNLIPAQQTS